MRHRKIRVRFIFTFYSLILLLPFQVSGTQADKNLIRETCLLTSKDHCTKTSPLRDLVINFCEQRQKTLHCKELKEAATELEKAKFLSCSDPVTFCDDVSAGGKPQLYSCGEGVGGVLLDELKQIILIPQSLIGLAQKLPSLPSLFKRCETDDVSKAAMLGTLRPKDLSDAELHMWSCADVNKFVRLKIDILLKRIEDRRQNEMIKQNRYDLTAYDLALSEQEIQALNYDLKQPAILRQALCYKPEEAAETYCRQLTKVVIGANAAHMGVKLARRLSYVETLPLPKSVSKLSEVKTAEVLAEKLIGGKKVYLVTDKLPPVKEGHVRIYRATSTPEPTQMSTSQRKLVAKDSNHVPLRGDQNFLTREEGRRHAFGENNPDGVSVTTDLGTAMTVGPQYIIIYDIPKKVFTELPIGEPALGERVFNFSVPDDYARGVLVKPNR